MPRLHGFTLIELLVVVTIIVILIAMLTPALDRAVYQAELAACGAQLKGVAQQVSLYAMDHGRAYPYRDTLGATYWQLSDLYNRYDGTDNDLRRVLVAGGVRLDLFNCPLAGGLAYGVDDTPADVVLGNYEMWFGWGYSGRKAMARLGDRFTWDAGDGERAFSAVASDHELMKPGYPEVQATHPDRDEGRMAFWLRDNERATALNGTNTSIGVTYSTWYAGINPADRGAVDRSFAYADGSVRRMTGLRFVADRNTLVDDRGDELTPLPEYNIPTGSTNHRYLPTE